MTEPAPIQPPKLVSPVEVLGEDDEVLTPDSEVKAKMAETFAQDSVDLSQQWKAAEERQRLDVAAKLGVEPGSVNDPATWKSIDQVKFDAESLASSFPRTTQAIKSRKLIQATYDDNGPLARIEAASNAFSAIPKQPELGYTTQIADVVRQGVNQGFKTAYYALSGLDYPAAAINKVLGLPGTDPTNGVMHNLYRQTSLELAKEDIEREKLDMNWFQKNVIQVVGPMVSDPTMMYAPAKAAQMAARGSQMLSKAAQTARAITAASATGGVVTGIQTATDLAPDKPEDLTFRDLVAATTAGIGSFIFSKITGAPVERLLAGDRTALNTMGKVAAEFGGNVADEENTLLATKALGEGKVVSEAEAIETAQAAATASLFFGAPGYLATKDRAQKVMDAAAPLINDTNQAIGAMSAAQSIAKMADGINASKLHQEAPAEGKEVLRQVLGEDADKPVVIDADIWNEFWATEGESVDTANLRSGAEVDANSGKVSVKLVDYLTEVATSKNGPTLLDHIRIDGFDMNVAEAKKHFADLEKTAKQVMDSVDEPEMLSEGVVDDSPQVAAVIKSQLDAVPGFKKQSAQGAAVYAEFFRTAAIRFNEKTGNKMTPKQLFDMSGLKMGPGDKNLRGSYRADVVKIAFTDDADPSTIIHEGSHFFLDFASRIVASTPENNPFTEDLNTLGKWWSDNAAGVYKNLNDDLKARVDALGGVQAIRDNAQNFTQLYDTDKHALWQAMHEYFATGFEKYVREGKAPSKTLQRVFASFASWISRVYRNIRGNRLDSANLTEDARQVMKKMLAVDSAIEAQEKKYRHGALLEEMAGRGKEDPEFQKLIDRTAKLREDARAAYAEKLYKQLAAEYKQVDEGKRLEIAYEALANITDEGIPRDKGYFLADLMRKGQIGPIAIDDVIDAVGADKANEFKKKYQTASDGMSISEIAAVTAITDMDRVIEAMADELPFEDALLAEEHRLIDQETFGVSEDELRMEVERMLNDEHSQAAADYELAAIRSLIEAGMSKPDMKSTVQAMIKSAEIIDAQVRAHEAKVVKHLAINRMNPDKWRRQAETEAKNTLRALAAGKLEEAEKAKRREVAALARADLEEKAIKDHERQVKVIRRASKKEFRKAISDAGFFTLIGQDGKALATFDNELEAQSALNATPGARLTREQLSVQLLDNLLATIDMQNADKKMDPQMWERKAEAEFTNFTQFEAAGEKEKAKAALARYNAAKGRAEYEAAALKEAGMTGQELFDARNRLVAAMNQKLTGEFPSIPTVLRAAGGKVNVDELSANAAGLIAKALETLIADAKNRRTIMYQNKRQTLEKAQADGVETVVKNAPKEPLPDQGIKGLIVGSSVSTVDLFTKLSSLVKVLDGGQYGWFFDNLLAPLNSALVRMHNRIGIEVDKFNKAYAKYTWLERSMAWKRPKEIAGGGLGRKISHDQLVWIGALYGTESGRVRLDAMFPNANWDVVLNALSDKDLNFIESIWDQNETFKTDIEDQQLRTRQTPPKWLESVPFTVRGRKMKGGYATVKYKNQRPPSVEDEMKGIVRGNVTQNMSAGFLEERTGAAKNPELELSIDVHNAHIRQVAKEIYLREEGQRYDALMNGNSPVRIAIEQKWGPAWATELRNGINYAYVGNRDELAWNMLNFIRGNVPMAGLGLNVWSGLQQPLGLTNAIAHKDIGYRGIAAAAFEWMSSDHPEASVKAIMAKDPTMARRWEKFGFSTDTQEALTSTQFMNLVPRSFSRFSMQHIKYLQMLADVPTWLAAYNKYRKTMPEDKAAARAGQVVRETMGSGDETEMSKIQRNQWSRLLMTFSTYPMTQTNQMYVALKGARSWKGMLHLSSVTFHAVLAASMLSYLAAGVAKGAPLGPEDEDESTKYWATLAAKSAINSLPLGSAFWSLTVERRPDAVAIVRPITSGVSAARKLWEKMFSDEGISEKQSRQMAKDFVNTAPLLPMGLGVLPWGQINKIFSALTDTDQEDAAQRVRAAILGPPPKQ